MNGKRKNNLVLIEGGKLRVVCLDDRLEWKLGRGTSESRPDICLHSNTVSRKHGTFMNMDGYWFYLDENGKNGTIHNGRQITKGIGGRIKPVMLENGDIFIFGGGADAGVSSRTIWAMYYEYSLDNDWRIEDTHDLINLSFSDGKESLHVFKPGKGTVVDLDDGMAIYMGNTTYINGNMKVTGN